MNLQPALDTRRLLNNFLDDLLHFSCEDDFNQSKKKLYDSLCHINGTPVGIAIYIDNKNLMTVTNKLKYFCYKYSSYCNMLDLVDGLNHIKAELDYFLEDKKSIYCT